MVKAKRIDSYGHDVMVEIIFDVLNSDWPAEFKKHILLKELLWRPDAPRGVNGANNELRFSKEAEKRWKKNVEENRKPRDGLIVEHAVPRQAIYKILINQEPTKDFISNILRTNIVRVFVTKDEDDKLNKLNLRSKMPENWDRQDILARHKQAGIEHSSWLPKKFEQIADD